MGTEYKDILNDAQYEAVTAEDKRLLFLAGAGVGKTHTMMYRTAYLVEHGVDPKNILLLTFTNKAAYEMVERLAEMEIAGITACTFHSFCARLLRIYGNQIKLNPKFTILTQSDSESIMRMFRPKKFNATPKELAEIESYATNKDISIREACSHFAGVDAIESDVEKIIEKAKRYRQKNDLISYDDLLTETIRLLKENPDTAAKLRNRFKHVMVDEYQDTNKIQDRILDLIGPEYLAVVGDDCQSLYAFRGAEVENILTFPDRHDCRIIKIEKNYRSNQQILDLSNNMMQLYCGEGFPKKLTATTNKGKAPVLVRPENAEEEANFIVSRIQNWLRLEKDPSELCILTRASRASSLLEAKLAAENIPYEKRGGPKFFESDHIQNVLALFEITRNRSNQIAWFKALMIIRNIGDTYARRISAMAAEDINNLLSEKYKSKVFYPDLEELYEAVSIEGEWHDVLKKLTEYYIHKSLSNIFQSRSEKKDELEDRIIKVEMPDLEVLERVAKQFEDPEEFLDSLLTSNVPDLEPDEDKIIISTIHSAKGLEFDAVIVMGLAEGTFPRESNDEELRCLYVALTRPREFLILTSPMFHRTRNGWARTRVPIFLDGLVHECTSV